MAKKRSVNRKARKDRLGKEDLAGKVKRVLRVFPAIGKAKRKKK